MVQLNSKSEEIISYVDKAYAGLIGMIAGVIYGSPLESDFYNPELIKKYFDFEKRNIFKYKKYAADDDINGPFIFSKSYFSSKNEIPDSREIGECWLENVRYERGTFWWGPSTERKAFENLKEGIQAPRSGSKDQNGEFLSNQIGGQIFIDSWGIIFGGEPLKAVKAAENAARVSHDENAVEGAKFVSACISLAFNESNILEIVKKATSFLSEEYLIKKMALEFVASYEDGNTYEEAIKIIEKYSEGKNFAHILPNAAIIVSSLLWGEGNFNQSINLTLQRGWDTDCNASNVGTILGVLTGSSEIPSDIMALINDEFILSSGIGVDNIGSISTYIKKIVAKRFAVKINDQFYHPNATYGIQLSNRAKSKLVVESNRLVLLVNGLNRNQTFDIYKKNLYSKADLQDTRYQPVFSPALEPGDIIDIEMSQDLKNIEFRPYVKALNKKEKYYVNTTYTGSSLNFILPKIYNNLISEVGIEVYNNGNEFQQVWGEIPISFVKVTKSPKYSLTFEDSQYEMDTVSPYVADGGNLYVSDKFYEHDMNTQVMRFYTFDNLLALAGTMDKYAYGQIEYYFILEKGEVEIVFHGENLRNFYAFGMHDQMLSVSKISSGERTILHQENYEISYNELHSLKIDFRKEQALFYVDGEQLFTLDCETKGGLHGFFMEKAGCGEIVKVNLEFGGSHEESFSFW